MLEAIERLDVAAFQWLGTRYRSFLLDEMMAGLSELARGGALWIALAALIAVFYPPRWSGVVQVILAVGVAYFLTDAVAKPSLNRQRPFERSEHTLVHGSRPTTRSLPSGHTSTSVAAAYALTRVAPAARLMFWTLAGLVAFSRIYLGVHYPADVVAGCVVGFAVGAFVVADATWRCDRERADASPGHQPSH